ncbi:MAG: YbaY family lipoprotein [Thiotrichales bacterium]|nr:YbaY family lipoprotein [Thiotrichales bacterium]
MFSLAKPFSLSLLTLLGFALASCQANPTKPEEKAVKTQATNTLSGLDENKVVIQGVVTYTENRFLLGNQTLLVMLEDVSRQDVPAELISQDKHEIKGQIPLTFAIHYDKRKLKVGHRYNLRAQILDTTTGAVNWLSPQPYPYVPGLTTNINIKVRSFDSQVRKASQFQTFICGKEKLTVLLIGNKIQLNFQGRQWILPQVKSASGAKYQTGSISFWMKGSNAVFMETGKPAKRCALEQ